MSGPAVPALGRKERTSGAGVTVSPACHTAKVCGSARRGFRGKAAPRRSNRMTQRVRGARKGALRIGGPRDKKPGASPWVVRTETAGALSKLAPHRGLARETRRVRPPPRPGAAPAEPAPPGVLSSPLRRQGPTGRGEARRGCGPDSCQELRGCLNPGPDRPSPPRAAHPARRSPCPGKALGAAASAPASSAPPGGRCSSRTRRRDLTRGRSRRRCRSLGSPCRSPASRPGSPASWCQCPGRRGPGSP